MEMYSEFKFLIASELSQYTVNCLLCKLGWNGDGNKFVWEWMEMEVQSVGMGGNSIISVPF